MRLKRHYYTAYLKTWDWNPETNNIDMETKKFEKNFTNKQLKKQLYEDKWVVLGYTLLGALTGCVGFLGTWVSGLIFIGCIGFLGFLIGLLNYFLTHYFNDYEYDLGEEDGFMESAKLKYIFIEEIAQNQENKKLQEELAFNWRKKHPLEEKVRLAMTGNPNYVADLLRYCELIKPSKNIKKYINEKIVTDIFDNINNNTQINNNNKITVKYLNTINNNKRKKTT